MDNKIKIYTSVLVFSTYHQDAMIMTDMEDIPPTWLIKNESKETLDIIKDGLYNITGIGKNWYPTFLQSGVFELFSSYKEIYILYTVYFPYTFEISNASYMWKKISELKENNKLYNMIRYVYTQRKYV